MKIEHLAVWVTDLEAVRRFYETYFGARAGGRYHNPNKNFSSYFLSFESGCRLELMHRPDVPKEQLDPVRQRSGWIHVAMSVGSKERVDHLTDLLRAAGHEIVGEPRTTGDGYYESVVRDPEGNMIEITV